MALQALKKIQSADRVLNQFQENVDRVLQPLLANVLADGRLVTGISIVSGTPARVEHKLGRAIRGWLVVDKNANADVWRSTSTLSDVLILNSSANVTLTLWVF